MTRLNLPFDLNAEWSFPTHIILAQKQIKNLPSFMAQHNLNLPLIITDTHLAQSATLKKILKLFDKTIIGFGIFTIHPQQYNKESLPEAIRLWRSGGFDSIIAFGGGRVMDYAKLVKLFAPRDSDLAHLTPPTTTTPLPYLIAMPTLAGSGNETRPHAIIQNRFPIKSEVICHEGLLPNLILYDPLLPATASPSVITGAAMHALTIAVESWCTEAFNPLADASALHTIDIVFKYLETAYREPDNIKAQSLLMGTTVTTGIAAHKGTGGATTLAHALHVLFGIHYGTACGVLLPYVLAYHRPSIDNRLKELADRLHIKGGANGIIKTLQDLRHKTAIPSKLGALIAATKLKGRDKAAIEAMSTEDITTSDNPLRLTKKAATEIIDAAMNGKMKYNR